MTELDKLIEDYEKRTGEQAMEKGIYNEYVGSFHMNHTYGFVLDLVKTITHLRFLTSWHYAPEVPESEGDYLGEFEGGYVCDGFEEHGRVFSKTTYYKDHYSFGGGNWTRRVATDDSHMDVPMCDTPIRWAYLPKEGE